MIHKKNAALCSKFKSPQNAVQRRKFKVFHILRPNRIARKLTTSSLMFSLIFSAYESRSEETLGENSKDKHNELIIGMTQEFDTLNPIITNMMASFYILEMTHRGLMMIDGRGRKIPQLVEKVPTLKNGLAKRFKEAPVNKSGKPTAGAKPISKIRSIWKLRESARWGDGKPITCEDYIFSHKVALSGNVAIPSIENFQNVEKIEADPKDPKKCIFVSSPAKWNFNHLSKFFALPKHIEGPIFEKHGKTVGEYDKSSNYVQNLKMPALWNGPYRLIEAKPGSHVTLKRNKYFYGDAAKFDKIVVKIIPDTNTLEANLLSGTIDMISNFGLSFDQALKFSKKIEKKNLPYKIHFKSAHMYEHIDCNLENPILKDRNVREALYIAIDRKELANALFDGKQIPALHFLAPDDPWYTDDPQKISIYSSSKRRAKKLLEKAGWKLKPGNANDGYRYQKQADGSLKKLELKIIGAVGQRLQNMIRIFIQDSWKKIGVDLKIENLQARMFFGDQVRKAKYTDMAMYSFVNLPENTPYSVYHSKMIPRKENGFVGVNRTKWKNPIVDDLLERIDLEFDDEKRLQMVHRLLGEYTKDLPALPLFYRADTAVAPKGLKGFELTGTFNSDANFIENWHF